MFELFPDQPAYEFPTFINVAYALAWAFVLSSLIAIVHRLTFRGDTYPRSFFQSMVLGSLVTAIVMLAIGDSLARGLGVFGAMAIIRFRTRITDPRDVIFLFAALSTGLAIGVFGYSIAFVGSLMFCLVAIILYFSPFSSGKTEILLSLSVPADIDTAFIFSTIRVTTSSYSIRSISTDPQGMIKYQIKCFLKKGQSLEVLIRKLGNISEVSQLKVNENQPSRF